MTRVAHQPDEAAAWRLTGSDRIDREQLEPLRQRRNLPGFAYLLVHLTVLASTGVAVHVALGSWWLAPAMLAHGTVLVLLFAPLHECSHLTAFRTRWLNDAVGIFVGALTLRPFYYFMWRHREHHAFTQCPARDPDLVPLPRSVGHYLALVFGLEFWPKLVGTLWRGTTGRLNERERVFIPAGHVRRACMEIRGVVALYGLAAAVSIALGSPALLVYWLVPRVLGEPILRAIRMAEHTAAEESPDLLANTRTTLTNPVLRLLYWNMPFHAEHHLAASVPFHALPKLHRHVRPVLGVVANGYLAAHADILRAMARKRAQG